MKQNKLTRFNKFQIGLLERLQSEDLNYWDICNNKGDAAYIQDLVEKDMIVAPLKGKVKLTKTGRNILEHATAAVEMLVFVFTSQEVAEMIDLVIHGMETEERDCDCPPEGGYPSRLQSQRQSKS